MLRRIIDEELAWQASLQLPNGALPMYAPMKKGDVLRVCPYFSCIAARALLLRSNQYAAHVRRYLDWHIRHLNSASEDYNGVDGTIYDYLFQRVGEANAQKESLMRSRDGKPYYDSTDAYAALFLDLVCRYDKVVDDKAFLVQNRNTIFRVYRAMRSTMDGALSIAKPDWPIQYLMDNCEVWVGFSAAERLFHRLHTVTEEAAFSVLALESAALRDQVAEGIEERLWNPHGEVYRVGISKKGTPVPRLLNLGRYYPDAMAQLFPMMTGILPPEGLRARNLYEKISRRFSTEKRRWENMQHMPRSSPLTAILARTATCMGDEARVIQYLAQYERLVLQGGHKDAQNAECAHVALAADALLRLRGSKP